MLIDSSFIDTIVFLIHQWF